MAGLLLETVIDARADPKAWKWPLRAGPLLAVPSRQPSGRGQGSLSADSPVLPAACFLGLSPPAAGGACGFDHDPPLQYVLASHSALLVSW